LLLLKVRGSRQQNCKNLQTGSFVLIDLNKLNLEKGLLLSLHRKAVSYQLVVFHPLPITTTYKIFLYFSVIEFRTKELCEEAVKVMNKHEILGRKIIVKEV